MLEKLAEAEERHERVGDDPIQLFAGSVLRSLVPRQSASPFETAEERFARQIFGLGQRHPQSHLRGVIDTFARTLATKLRRPDIRTASDRCVARRRQYDTKHGSPEGARAAEEQAVAIIEACMNERRAPGAGGRALEALNALEHAYLR